MNIIILLIIFVVLAIVGMPIGFSILISSIITIMSFSTIPLSIAIEKMLLGIDNFLLLAIPLFVLAANIMNKSGITTKIFDFARSLVGRIPGALGHANILASIFFAGMSGAAVADSAALGKIEIKAMEDQGYPKDFAAAITCASATIGPIIPPSIPMVIYASIAQVSVAELFLGGILPGFLIALVLMIMVYIISVRRSYPQTEKFSLSELARSFKLAFLPLMAPILIIAGILSGLFSPTEAAAVVTVYAFVLGFFLLKELKMSDLPKIFIETALTSAAILFIISISSLFSWYLTINQIGALLVGFVQNVGLTPISFLIITNIVLILLGMVMETTTVLMILTPLLVPVVQLLGIDLVYFGVVMVLNLMIGLSTPPFGLGLFTVSGISDTKLEKVIVAILPFLPVLFIALILLIIIPEIVMFLPSLL
jgi:tripartite ATP-independent transporter DctM subunit